jgi:hypothetical protein
MSISMTAFGPVNLGTTVYVLREPVFPRSSTDSKVDRFEILARKVFKHTMMKVIEGRYE